MPAASPPPPSVSGSRAFQWSTATRSAMLLCERCVRVYGLCPTRLRTDSWPCRVHGATVEFWPCSARRCCCQAVSSSLAQPWPSDEQAACSCQGCVRADAKQWCHAGELDRKRLGELVFQDASKRKQLNAALHPLIMLQLGLQILSLWARHCLLMVRLPHSKPGRPHCLTDMGFACSRWSICHCCLRRGPTG